MTKPNEAAPDVRASRLERIVSRLDDVEKYLREEADFNRSWTDGRRGANMANSEQYIAARITAANIRDEWADATDEAKKILKIIIAEPVTVNYSLVINNVPESEMTEYKMFHVHFKAEVNGTRFLSDTKVRAQSEKEAAEMVLKNYGYSREITAVMKG